MTSWACCRPPEVDPDSGYRWYAPGQLDSARLVASLRQLGVPLAQIKVILGLHRRPPRSRSALTGLGLKPIMLPAGTWPATSLTA